MDQAKRGAAALESSDASTAITCYTKALIEHPLSPDYFIQRSIAFTRLRPARHDLALRDAEIAVILSQRRAKREKIQAAQHRRVVSLYGLGNYADANYVLETMQRWRSKDNKKDMMEGDMWKAKVESKLKALPESEQAATVKEYPDIDVPDSEGLRASLETQLKPDGSYRFDDQEEDSTTEQDLKPHDQTTTGTTAQSQKSSNTTLPPSTTGATTVSSTPSTAMPPDTKLRYEWYQNADSVTITIYVKGVSKDAFEIEVKEHSIYISFPHPSNQTSDFTFSLDPLFAPINMDTSKWTVMSTKVEVILKKSRPGQKWPALEGSQASTASAINSRPSTTISNLAQIPKSGKISTGAPSYPTSSKSGPKDWDKVAKELTAKKKSKASEKKSGKATGQASGSDDEEIDSDYESGDPVDGFFKKLYAGSDEDTRRAMMKSFQESNGTTLSTNWSEVGKGKVEPYKSKHEED